MARPDKAYLEKQTSRRPEKKKKSLGEGSPDSRYQKITFKNYLRQIEEDLLDEYDEYNDDYLSEGDEMSHDEMIAAAKKVLNGDAMWDFLKKAEPDYVSAVNSGAADGWEDNLYVDSSNGDVYIDFYMDHGNGKSILVKVPTNGDASGVENLPKGLTDITDDIPDILE